MKNIFVQKTFRSKLFLDPKFKVQKVFGTKNVWFNKIGCKKMLTQNKFRFKKFGSKLILCLKKLGPKSILGRNSLVKIGSVTSESLLIWTNVTKSNDA